MLDKKRTKKLAIAISSAVITPLLLLSGCNAGTFNTGAFNRVKETYDDTAYVTTESLDSYTTISENESIPLSVIEADEENTAAESSAKEDEAFQEYDITVMMVGDNLMHMGVIYTGKQSDNTYDFSFLFNGITDFLNAADIKIINQETIMAGNSLGFSGFPEFNSPTEVGDAIANAGFNVVLHASNHAADKGIKGIESCIDFWSNHPEVLLTGIHKPVEEADSEASIPLLTVKDVTFAILNYTYGPNYEVVSSDLVKRMNLLCDRNPQSGAMDYTSLNPQVIEDIQLAKSLADVVIVCPHWGTEYRTDYSTYQQVFAQQMTAAGADLIIGTHPHVPQPIEWIEAENGGKSLCYYSLGNYVSTQKTGKSMLEGMAWVTYHVTEDSVTLNEEKTGVIPLVCHYSSSPVRIKNICPLEDYTSEMASSHGIIPYGGISFSLSDLQGWSSEIFKDWVLSKDVVLQ